MKKILLTAFEPFADFTENPTQIIVEKIQEQAWQNVDVKQLVLSVDFKNSLPIYLEKLQQFQPDFILNLGLAANTNVLRLEHLALNIAHDTYQQKNIRHQQTSTIYQEYGAISKQGENALFSTFPIDNIQQLLCKSGVPTIRSNYAGTYLCNFIYYHSLQWANKHQGTALFVHIPFTSEMVSSFCLQNSKSYPSLPTKLMVQAISNIIHFYLRENKHQEMV